MRRAHIKQTPPGRGSKRVELKLYAYTQNPLRSNEARLYYGLGYTVAAKGKLQHLHLPGLLVEKNEGSARDCCDALGAPQVYTLARQGAGWAPHRGPVTAAMMNISLRPP
mmetsp:Transcript_1256/g.3745  ORF Transcript_1256/g.3745 Transcript_1256/m.3745 type:complete len:110 (+) Transcript_1256:325-654(+)